jgi:hypothetical protein
VVLAVNAFFVAAVEDSPFSSTFLAAIIAADEIWNDNVFLEKDMV